MYLAARELDFPGFAGMSGTVTQVILASLTVSGNRPINWLGGSCGWRGLLLAQL